LKDPAMLFYTSDFLTGVTLLNMKERGQYITLLCLQQQLGHMTLKQMQTAVGKLSEAVMGKFIQDEEGLYYNHRADVEINKRKAHSEKQRENVQKRWNKNAEVIPSDVPKEYDGIYDGITVVIPLENENENININLNTSENVGNEESKFIPPKEEVKFIPPTVEEVRAYCLQRSNRIDAQHFVDYYTANGWVQGKGKKPIKDWKATVRTWERREKDGAGSNDNRSNGRVAAATHTKQWGIKYSG
jgi:hypothetical protein